MTYDFDALNQLADKLCDCADRTLNGRARELANELREALANRGREGQGGAGQYITSEKVNSLRFDGIEHVSSDLLAERINKYLAHALASRVPEADVRRLTLEEAERAMCEGCAKGLEYLPNMPHGNLHRRDTGGFMECRAVPIRALAAPSVPSQSTLSVEEKWKQCIERAREHKSYALLTGLIEDGPDPEVNYDKLMGRSVPPSEDK